jgi:hypothetical protein
MSNLSPSAAEILDNVITALQPAEELGGVDGTDEYIALMEAVAIYALNCRNTADSERGGWRPEARITMTAP